MRGGISLYTKINMSSLSCQQLIFGAGWMCLVIGIVFFLFTYYQGTRKAEEGVMDQREERGLFSVLITVGLVSMVIAVTLWL